MRLDRYDGDAVPTEGPPPPTSLTKRPRATQKRSQQMPDDRLVARFAQWPASACLFRTTPLTTSVVLSRLAGPGPPAGGDIEYATSVGPGPWLSATRPAQPRRLQAYPLAIRPAGDMLGSSPSLFIISNIHKI